MRLERILAIFFMSVFFPLGCSVRLMAQPPQNLKGLPLLYEENFSTGTDNWEFTDPLAWAAERDGDAVVLSLRDASQYEPPVRSPLNIALLKELWVSDFIMEVKVQSTGRVYGHRDLCFFYGWQSPSRFYYTHIATQADEHANSIFLVRDQPRVSIAGERTEGTEWKDDAYHMVRIERRSQEGIIRVFFDNLENPIMVANDRNFGYGRLGLGSFDDTGKFKDVRIWGIEVDPQGLSDADILRLFEGLRVADVSDAMDVINLADSGLVNPEFRPLWRDIENFGHQFCGIALTVRYVPTNRPQKNFSSPEEFSRREGEWYTRISPEPFVDHIKPGSVIVIDGAEDGDTGTIGSFNGLAWIQKGAVGIVTSGGVRDMDEVIKEEIPVYLRRFGRGIRPGRNEVESVNQPVQIGGVLVYPGDVVVADGDGVIVVPRKYAEIVAQIAKGVLDSDKANRRRLYEQMGRELDHTVKP
jgi:regulator of RNase E activity RraA